MAQVFAYQRSAVHVGDPVAVSPLSGSHYAECTGVVTGTYSATGLFPSEPIGPFRMAVVALDSGCRIGVPLIDLVKLPTDA
jgi:hypothetical protein